MDGPQFDAWTRRRFGLAAGSLLAGLLCAVRIEDAAAEKEAQTLPKTGEVVQTGRQAQVLRPVALPRHGRQLGHPHHVLQDRGEAVQPRRSLPVLRQHLLRRLSSGLFLDLPSDRALKTNFGSVDAADMLERVRSLPISTWNYTSDDASIRHIGPMAQDFTARSAWVQTTATST